MKNILTYSLFLIIGFVLGYLAFHKEVVKEYSVRETTETTETTRTEETIKEIEAVAPAIITKEEMPAFTEKYFEKVPEVKNNVAKWDTLTNDGFEAHIKYFIEQNLFVNSFKYPEKIVYKDKIVRKTIDSTVTKVVKELPAFQLGAGFKSTYEEEFKILPFGYLAANTKLWFLYATVEVRALIDNKNLQLKIHPEIEGKLSIGL